MKISSTKDKKQTAYKDTPIGKIPADWEVKKLGELGEVVTGLTYSPSQVRDTGLLVLRSSNVQDRVLVYNDNVYVDERDLKYNPVKKGDILICVRNGSRALIGKNARVDYKAEGLAFGAFMAIFRSVLNDYLFHFFDTDLYYKQIHVNLGATINSINNNDLRDFKIPLPPLPEQQRIAEVLSTWDQAIQCTEQLIRQKELRKKWLMQQLLTGKKRLKGFDGEWKSEILGNVVNLQHGYQFRDEDFVEEGIPVIKIRNVIGYDLVLSDMTFVDASRLEEFKSVVIENGDLLMSLTGNIGRVVEVKGIDKPMFQNYRVGKFTPIDKQITKAFLKFILSSDILFRQFNGLANQSAQANFGKQDMDKLKFRFPISIEEQTAIAEVLQAADEEIELLKAKAEKLKEQKKGLMQQLLTGRKRLNLNLQD